MSFTKKTTCVNKTHQRIPGISTAILGVMEPHCLCVGDGGKKFYNVGTWFDVDDDGNTEVAEVLKITFKPSSSTVRQEAPLQLE